MSRKTGHLDHPPSPRPTARRRLPVHTVLGAGAASAVLVLGLAALPLRAPSHNTQSLFFDVDAGTGALLPGTPGSPIQGTSEWRAYDLGFPGLPAATLLRSRVTWEPGRPERRALETSLRLLQQAQPEEAARAWTESDFEGRFLHEGDREHALLRLHKGAWALPVAWLGFSAVLLGLSGRWSRARERHRQRRGLCSSCGFDVQGTAGARCPECGKAIPPT